MDNIFTRAGNRQAGLRAGPVHGIYNVSGWYFKRTDYNDDWRGPYLCWHGVR